MSLDPFSLFKPLIVVDVFLLDRVAQPIVNWCGRRWGWRIDKMGEILNLTGIAAYIILYFLIVQRDTFSIAFMTVAVVINTAFHSIATVLALRLANRSGPNANRLVMCGMRMTGLLAAPVSLIPPIHLEPMYSAWIMLAGYYTLSCQHPPPKEERRRIPATALPEMV